MYDYGWFNVKMVMEKSVMSSDFTIWRYPYDSGVPLWTYQRYDSTWKRESYKKHRSKSNKEKHQQGRIFFWRCFFCVLLLVMIYLWRECSSSYNEKIRNIVRHKMLRIFLILIIMNKYTKIIYKYTNII